MTRVMGVVNVTPDSFVADIRTPDPAGAIDRARRLAADGAAIVDIGGESTRPGATAVPADIEAARVLPVIEGLAGELPAGTQISIDTRSESVARAAVAAGAEIINDMSASLGWVAGELGVGYVAAHMQGTPGTMQDNPHYDDVIGEVFDHIVATAEATRLAGAGPVWIDPGIGFGKTLDHNLELLAHIDRLVEAEFPVLIGVSRKHHAGLLHGASDAGVALGVAAATAADDRLEASLTLALWCARLGVDVVRVHDVAETVQALRVVAAGTD